MSHSIPHKLKEFKEPILRARTIFFETRDMERALSVLDGLMSIGSARRALEYETFRYTPMIPEGHPLKTEFRAASAAKQRRLYHARKHRDFVIRRDRGRCKQCGDEVAGRNATLDHIDPDGPNEPDNLQLLCRSCNSRKNRMPDQAARDKLETMRARQEAQWQLQEPVWELIENAQTCEELEIAQEAYSKLEFRLQWLSLEFFGEKAKELPGYDGSHWQWAEQKWEEHQRFLDRIDELYENGEVN